MTDADFTNEFRRVLEAATAWGDRAYPVLRDSEKPFRDDRHMRKFLAACHRGQEKAQNRVVELLTTLSTDDSLSDGTRLFRELLLRRTIDAIAFTLLGTDSHVVRRLVLHDQPPPVDLPAVMTAHREANRLNSESRLTLALVCDLTTFVHVADILRIDFRNSPATRSLIELKSGSVNQILSDQLDSYTPTRESLDALRNDPSIPARHQPQAARMLRQRMRLQQISEVVEKDEGIDIRIDRPIRLLGPTLVRITYDDFLDDLCKEGIEQGVAMGSVASTIHLGIAYADDPREAFRRSRISAFYAAFQAYANASEEHQKVRDEIEGLVPRKDTLRACDLLTFNLRGMSDRPFPTWSINPNYKVLLASKKLVVTSIFDLPGFIWLARHLGAAAGLLTRRETEEHARTLPRHFIPRWANRGLSLHRPGTPPALVLGGILSRMIDDLHHPADIVSMCTRKTDDG